MIFAVAYTGRIRCSLACLESFQVSKDGIKLDQIWERHRTFCQISFSILFDFLAELMGCSRFVGDFAARAAKTVFCASLCFIKIQEFSRCEQHVDQFCVSMGTVLPSLVKFSSGPRVGHLRRICRTCQMRCLPQICPSSSMRSKFVRKALQQARYVMMVPMWHRDIPGFLNQYQICQCVASVLPVLIVLGLRLKSLKLCQCLRLRFAFHWFYVQEAMNAEVFDGIKLSLLPVQQSPLGFSERDIEGSIKDLHIYIYEYNLI